MFLMTILWILFFLTLAAWVMTTIVQIFNFWFSLDKRRCFYVPSKDKGLIGIFKEEVSADKRYFYDLGSGDGRILRLAKKDFPDLETVGYELNPILSSYSRILNRISKIDIQILRSDFLEANLQNNSIIYIFLRPQLLLELKNSFSALKNSVIVSHGFPIPYLENKLTKKVYGEPFHTYIYRL